MKTKFQAGDRVVDPFNCGRGTVVDWESQWGHIGVRFDSYTDYVSESGFHSRLAVELISEDLYDSPLMKALR